MRSRSWAISPSFASRRASNSSFSILRQFDRSEHDSDIARISAAGSDTMASSAGGAGNLIAGWFSRSATSRAARTCWLNSCTITTPSSARAWVSFMRTRRSPAATF